MPTNGTIISELPTLRTGFATAVVDGKIYLIGGTPFQNRRGPYGLSTVEVYDPKTNSWEQSRRYANSHAQSAKTAVVNGTIYVCGGYNGADNRLVNLKFLDIVEAYDPQNDTWTRKARDVRGPCGFWYGCCCRIKSIVWADMFTFWTRSLRFRGV